MTDAPTDATITALYQRERRRVFASLVRLLGDFESAEEATQIAFVAALERWPNDGLPRNPVAWLVSAGRFRMIDRLRRDTRMAPWTAEAEQTAQTPPDDPPEIEDDQLRLIFTCCHPSLSDEAAIALTLREVCGLSTEAVAQAFLIAPATLAQRIVRAKAKIRDAHIPYEVPETTDLPNRLGRVLRVVYLVFTEGYASSGGDLLRTDLMAEAIRLARLILTLLPDAEVRGLLALMILQHARRHGRTTPEGELIPLDEQDRELWDHDAIAEGGTMVRQALGAGQAGPYTLQAAIAALHAEAPSFDATDWTEIAGLYAALYRVEPSPVIALNQAVAVAMRDGPEAGLGRIEPLLADPALAKYHLAHAAHADLLRRAGRPVEARAAYETALTLVKQGPEHRYLRRQLADLPK